MIIFSIVIILIISLVLAIRSLYELESPKEVIKITGRKKTSGVILFLKEKIIHYS